MRCIAARLCCGLTRARGGQIGATLDGDDFAARVVPALSRLFASNDRTIRRSLLESIDSYGPHLSAARARGGPGQAARALRNPA